MNVAVLSRKMAFGSGNVKRGRKSNSVRRWTALGTRHATKAFSLRSGFAQFPVLRAPLKYQTRSSTPDGVGAAPVQEASSASSP